MSGRSDDDELADLLRDLERDLDRLTDRLDADDAGDAEASVRRRSRPRRRSSSGPRPPSPGDLVRFTEEYTIPTVVAVLEATIRSLELLRGGLRLADPERRLRDARRGDAGRSAGVRDRVARELGDGASAAVERTLSDLRTALSAAELPEDDDARAILEDARSLTDEIERRLAESRGGRGPGDADRDEAAGRQEADERGPQRRRPGARDRDRRRRRSSRRGVGIEVRDADDEGDADDGRGADADDEGGDGDASEEAQVDVDAELESIRREVDGDESDPDDGDG